MHALMLWAALASVPVGKEAPGSAAPSAAPGATAASAATKPDPPATIKNGAADQQKKPPREPEVLEREYIEALRQSGRRGDAEPAEIVPALARLYIEIGRCEAMPLAERHRLRSRLATRLSEIRGELIRQVLAERRAQRRPPSPRRAAKSASANASRGGGSDALQLIELIQSTIAPESWQRAGGPGSIYFYRPLNALVIRQSGEVHHQVGGLLGALRK